MPGEDEEGPGEDAEAGPAEHGVYQAELKADLMLTLKQILWNMYPQNTMKMNMNIET